MSKGTYAVNEGGAPPPPAGDASFKSCLCALLVFIAICIIILLAGMRWSRDPNSQAENLGPNYDAKENKGSTTPHDNTQDNTSTTETTTTPSLITKLISKYTTQQTKTEGTTPVSLETTTITTPHDIILVKTSTSTTTSPKTISTSPHTTPQANTWETTQETDIKTGKTSPHDSIFVHTSTSSTSSTTNFTTTDSTPQGEHEGATLFSQDTSTTDSTTLYESAFVSKSTSSTSSTTNLTTSDTTPQSEHEETTPFSEDTSSTRSTTPNNNILVDTTTTDSLTMLLTLTDSTESSRLNGIITTTLLPPTETTLEDAATHRSETVVFGKHRSTTPTVTEEGETESTNITTPTPTTSHNNYFDQFKTKSTAAGVEETPATTQGVTETTENYDETTTEDYFHMLERIGQEALKTESTTLETDLGTDATRETTLLTRETTGETTSKPAYADRFGFISSRETTTTPDSLQSSENINEVDITRFTNSTAISQTTEPTVREEIISSTERKSTTTPIPNEEEPVCTTSGCKSAASRMLSLMDHSIEPCDDFYAFACGGADPDSAESDTLARLSGQLYEINNESPLFLQKFKNFYDNCVEYEYDFKYQQRIAIVGELVKSVGTLVSEAEELPADFDLTELFAKLLLRQFMPVMDVNIDIGKQSSSFTLQLTLPTTNSPLTESGFWSALSEAKRRCLNEERRMFQQENLNLTALHETYQDCQKNHTVYLNAVENAIRELGLFSHLESYNQTQKIEQLRLNIEWNVADNINNLPPPSITKKILQSKDYTLEKVSDLQVQYPFLKWGKLFESLTGHEIDDNTMVQLYYQDYFRNLSSILNAVPDWEINNALVAMYAEHLYDNFVIPKAKHNRENYCIKASASLFRDVASNMYMKTWPKNEVITSQKLMLKVFNQLKKNLTQAFTSENWIDPATQISLLGKLQNLTLIHNKEEDRYNNDTYMSMRYNEVAIELYAPGFPNNTMDMIMRNRHMLYNLEGSGYTVQNLWNFFVTPYEDQPISFYSKGVIVAPMGMLQGISSGLPGYLLMGRLGLALGREIGHHFAPVGMNYDATLEPDAQAAYDYLQRTMSDVLLYTKTTYFEGHTITFKIDNLSTNERIADNIGLALATAGYNSIGNDFELLWLSETYSKEKIFFIAAAQDYCLDTEIIEYMFALFESDILPAPLMVENIVSNSKAFEETFECKPGSKMNYPIKVQFPYLDKSDDSSYNYDDYTLTTNKK